MRIFIFCSIGFPYVFAPVFSTPAFSTPAFSAPPPTSWQRWRWAPTKHCCIWSWFLKTQNTPKCVCSRRFARSPDSDGKTLQRSISSAAGFREQGRSDGGYIGIYTPKSVYLTKFYVVTGCFFFSLTQDKLLLILKLEWLVKIYTPPPKKNEIPGYAAVIERGVEGTKSRRIKRKINGRDERKGQ